MHNFRTDEVALSASVGNTSSIACTQGQAEKNGVEAGSCILTVGCWNAIGQPLVQVIHALKFAPRPVTVTFVVPDTERQTPFSKASRKSEGKTSKSSKSKHRLKTSVDTDLALTADTELAILEVSAFAVL